MEVSIGDYGRMMFEMMVGREDLPDHWKSIKAEAEPLVRELLELNKKMSPSYEIHGYSEGGKKKLSKHKRMELAQKKLWGCKASKLKLQKKQRGLWMGSALDTWLHLRILGMG